MTLQEALVGMNPQDGDLIKTENYFAMYSSNVGWVGSLSEMIPGQGYMMYSSADATLEFPIRASLNSRATKDNDDLLQIDLPEIVSAKDGHNMSIVATLKEPLSGEKLLVAYADGEVRCIAELIDSNNKGLYLLTASAELDQILTFKIFDIETGEYLAISEEMNYQVDAIVGNLIQPVILSLDNDSEHVLNETLVAPNPFDEFLTLDVPMLSTGSIKLVMTDLNGRTLLNKELFNDETGMLRIRLDSELNNLNAGLYILTLSYNGIIERIKLKKQ